MRREITLCTTIVHREHGSSFSHNGLDRDIWMRVISRHARGSSFISLSRGSACRGENIDDSESSERSGDWYETLVYRERQTLCGPRRPPGCDPDSKSRHDG